MLRQRLITAIILAPTLTYLIYAGGWWYGALVLALLSIGTWEFIRLAHGSGVVPARWLMIPGVWALACGVLWQSGYWLGPAIAALLVAATAWHAWQYEHGATDPLQGWAVTIAAPLYLGVLGGYLLALRALPDGLWWTLTILPAVWVADGGAYMVGRLLGKHKLSVRLSPNKTWEGLVGGLVLGPLFGALLAAMWEFKVAAGSLLTWQHALLVSFLVALISPVGDLGISMLKRQAIVKDTGSLFVGHGGVLDRIDSWLVAGVVGYMYITAISG